MPDHHRSHSGNPLAPMPNASFYIGGQWVDPATSATIDVVDPSTEEVFGKVAHQLVENGVAEHHVRRMLSDNPGSLLNL